MPSRSLSDANGNGATTKGKRVMSDGLSVPRRYAAIAALSFGIGLVVIDGAITTVALPTIARDLGVESSAVVQVVTIHQLVFVMTLLPFSSLGDRVGHRRLYLSGLALFTAASLFCFLVDSLPVLLLVRAVQALGASATLSVSSALVRSVYPASQLGRGIGLTSLVVSCGSALAPTLGGMILELADWPWVFAVAAPFGLLSMLLGAALPDQRATDARFDIFGAVLCAASFCLMIGGLESSVHANAMSLSAIAIAGGIAIATALVLRELKEARPIMPVDLLSKPVFALSISAALVAFLASMIVLLSLPFRLQHQYGFTPGEVGAMLATWPLVMMIVAPIAGLLSDRIPAALLGGIGMAVSATALVALAYLPEQPEYWNLAWRMGLYGAGFGLFLAPNAALIMGSAPPERSAAAGGLLATTRLTGQAFGATLTAALLALGQGIGSVPALVAAGLTFVAGIFSLARFSASPIRPAVPER